MLRYRVDLVPDDNGTLLVTSPDLPIVTYGEDRAAALRQALEAAEALLASLIDRHEPLPVFEESEGASGDCIRLPLQTELKVRLYAALRDSGFDRAELQRRLGWPRESIERLFRLDRQSSLLHLEEAFRVLGCDIAIEVRPTLTAA